MIKNDWIIEIDIQRTRKFYEEYDIEEDCKCNNCMNYRVNCDFMSPELLDFFNQLGVDPRKEGEFMSFYLNNNNEVLYLGFYHLVGKILEGPKKVSDKWQSTNLIKIDNFEFAFSSAEIACVPEDFPEPIIQLEFSSFIPWRLEEKHD